MRRYYKKPVIQTTIAKKRIIELFKLAEENKEFSDKYVTLARKISMKLKVPIPKELRKRFCKHCYKYLTPGKNVRIRKDKDFLIYTCLECNKNTKFYSNK
ncbi:ribonuclease P [Candidatus Woesearchaeota archaeon]|nr:ribonuclease P [Candidatus Woesearchaeota archaeon]